MKKVISKTYQNLVCVKYSTDILVKGKRVDLRFYLGGKTYPKIKKGSVLVTDMDVMEALENHKDYGKRWKLIACDPPELLPKELARLNGEKLEAKVPEPPLEEEPEVVEPEEGTPALTEEPESISLAEVEAPEEEEEKPEEETKEEVVPEVHTVQQAKNWLNDKKSIPFSRLINRDAVLSEAKGENVVFPNLKK